MEVVAENHYNPEVIQCALSSLTNIVRAINKTLVERTLKDQIGFFASVKLTKRTNSLFNKLIRFWLVNNTLVEYFVFKLRGFEFLLDTIASDSK